MKYKEEQDSFPPKEAAGRFRAALLGARLAGHMPMKAKKAAKKTKPKKKR
jgi:hypothetical protein